MGREEGCSSVLRTCVHRRSMCIKSGGACASLSLPCVRLVLMLASRSLPLCAFVLTKVRPLAWPLSYPFPLSSYGHYTLPLP